MNTIQWLWNSIEVLMILGVSIIIIGISTALLFSTRVTGILILIQYLITFLIA